MNEQRRLQFKKMLEPQVVSSNWRLTRGDGALFRFVKPQVVIEVKATDVQSEESSGKLVKQMVLSYHNENGWQAMRKLPCASLLFPVLIRIRDDKQVNPTDIRIEQVLERCFVPETDKHAKSLELPKSRVLRREVYTKSSKKGMAVRKLVLWKTNKEKQDEKFPAYVVHFTDYSPGRKDPLKREVRRAPNETSAAGIADKMIEANIKKGWQRV